ncbi:MAG: hypothetical protein NC312_02475 [Bacteroides fragilis]|nr:hypothetical protein [Bacteroides fragilis]
MPIEKKREEILNAALALGILGFLVLIGITNLCHYRYALDADIASDAVLGKLIWDSKEIVPGTWYIAEETRLICMPNAAALFYGLTHNMTMSAGLACCAMTALILWSALFFGKALRFQKKELLLFGFLCLMLPADSTLLELSYLYASYYAVHVAVLFFTFGVYLEARREKSIKWIKPSAAAVLSLILGMQGARGILMIYGPLFGMEALWSLYDIYCGKKKERADIFISLWAAALLAVSFLGMCFPFSKGQELSRNIRNGFSKLCIEVVPDMLAAMGFGESQPLLWKIGAAALLLTALYLIIDIVIRIFKREGVKTAEWGFLILCSSPAVTALMVAFTTVESTERYYFLSSYAAAYAEILFFRKMREAGKPWYRMRFCLAFVTATLSIVCFYHNYLPVLRAEEPPRTDAAEVVRFLEENDFRTAYSTFENANTMTVLSNGRIRVAAVASVEKMDICKWMSSTDWYVPYMPFEAVTAYVIPETQLDAFDVFLAAHEDDIRLEAQIGRFYIYRSDYNFSCLE